MRTAVLGPDAQTRATAAAFALQRAAPATSISRIFGCQHCDSAACVDRIEVFDQLTTDHGILDQRQGL